MLLVAVLVAGCTSDAPDAIATSTPLDSGEPDSDSGGPVASPVTSAGEVLTVARVIDGDTIVVRLASGVEESVRLLGINAPEAGECLADEAAEALAELLANQRVRLEPDTTDRDEFGRLLRYVHAGRTHVNAELVDSGLALSRAVPPDTQRQAELDASEQDARDRDRGQWAPDACGPTSAAVVRIAMIEPDAPPSRSWRISL